MLTGYVVLSVSLCIRCFLDIRRSINERAIICFYSVISPISEAVGSYGRTGDDTKKGLVRHNGPEALLTILKRSPPII